VPLGHFYIVLVIKCSTHYVYTNMSNKLRYLKQIEFEKGHNTKSIWYQVKKVSSGYVVNCFLLIIIV
jgi:hypothetical protein